MASKLDIFNLALNMMGAEKVSDTAENRKEAIVLNNIYDFVLEEVIADFPYRFVTKTGQIHAEIAKAVTSITHSAKTATVTLSTHGYETGYIIEILDASPENYNGKFSITKVDSNSFTYKMAEDPGTSASGSAITARHSHVEFDNAYILPADFVKAVRLEQPTVDDRFNVENGFLYTDEPTTIFLKYIRNSYTEEEFTSSFYWLLASRLAAEGAVAITGDRQFAHHLASLYEQRASQTKIRDIGSGFDEKRIDQNYLGKDYTWLALRDALDD